MMEGEDRIPPCYDKIALDCGLDSRTTMRYLIYMRSRWADEELMHCRTGYAREWADRFKAGIEYAVSDAHGQKILDRMNPIDTTVIESRDVTVEHG